MAQVKGGVMVARSLKAAGVDTVFFLLGTPLSEIVWGCHDEGIRLIHVRHEQAAAMAAHAYGRVSGKPGVCLTGCGADTCNAVTGVAVAQAFCDPMVAIGGSVIMSSREMGSFEELDQLAVMKPVCKQAWEVKVPDRIPDYVDMAFRFARADRPGPVYLDFPSDVLLAQVDTDKVKPIAAPQKTSRPSGDPKAVEEAIAMLQKAERPIVIAGSGCLWSEAGSDLQKFVEAGNIPFFTTPVSRGLIPEDHDLCFLAARSYAWEKADLIFVIGTRANWIVQYLRAPRFADGAKFIMVNIDSTEIGHNRPIDLGIVGDAKAVLQQLTAGGGKFTKGAAARKEWTESLRKINADREAKMQPILNSNDKPIHPLRLCNELKNFLDRDAILSVDGNETLNFARQSIPTYVARHRLNIGPSGCIGTGVPFGIGAKVAKPNTQVVTFCGDGGVGMHIMEMDTAVRYGINLVVVLSNNGGWSGLPTQWPTGRDLGFKRYDKIVEAIGGLGLYVEDPKDIRPALEKAFASGKPALINVITSPVKATTQLFASERMAGLRGKAPMGVPPSTKPVRI